MFRTLLTALLCLALPAVAIADETVGARAEFWSMDLTGDLGVTSGDFQLPSTSLTDTSTDTSNGLGLDSDNPVGASAWLNLGPFFLFGRYTPIDITGSDTITNLSGFKLKGLDLASGALDTSLNFNMYDAGIGLNVLNLDDLPVRIQVGLLAQVKVLDGSIDVTGSTNIPGTTKPVSTTDTKPFTFAIPMVGGHIKLGLADFLSVGVQGAGVVYNGDHLYDVDARIELSPIPFVGISGGYRIMDLSVDESAVNLNATFKGPFIEAFIRF